MTLWVCPLSRLEETVNRTGARRVISLLSAGTVVTRPPAVLEADHLDLSMHDIADIQPDMTPPGVDHVERILAFARGWDRQSPVVVHCYAGISRSTATAYIIASALMPHRDAGELAQALRLASPSATPNPRLIAIADDMLGRNGQMVRAIAGIGRGADAFEGVPFAFPVEQDR